MNFSTIKFYILLCCLTITTSSLFCSLDRKVDEKTLAFDKDAALFNPIIPEEMSWSEMRKLPVFIPSRKSIDICINDEKKNSTHVKSITKYPSLLSRSNASKTFSRKTLDDNSSDDNNQNSAPINLQIPKPILQRSTNSPVLTPQEKIDLLYPLTHNTDTSIEAVIIANNNICEAQKKLSAKSYVSKTIMLGLIGATAHLTNLAIQTNNPHKVFGVDDAAVASLAGQAAKPLLVGGIVLAILYKLESWIRAEDVAHIRTLERDFAQKIADHNKTIDSLYELMTNAQERMGTITIISQEARDNYSQMKQFLDFKIMPKINQLVRQTKNKKGKDKDVMFEDPSNEQLSTENKSFAEQISSLRIDTGSHSPKNSEGGETPRFPSRRFARRPLKAEIETEKKSKGLCHWASKRFHQTFYNSDNTK